MWVALAVLRRARGIKGELVAENLRSEPDRFSAGLAVTLMEAPESDRGRPAELERSWMHQGSLVLKFRGIDTRSEAETLQGMFVCIPEAQRPSLPEGQIYLDDLIGCEVFTADGIRRVGCVTGWQDLGGPVLLEIGPDLLIPYVPEICREVDVPGRRIGVEMPEGLEDLNRK
jgi:16S rRNA processing protein RimM